MLKNSLGIDKAPADTKVCVAMSGGVDSSATTYLLKKEGYDVFGLTMDLLREPYCPKASSIKDAKKVADFLKIPHYFIDLKQEFADRIVKYFSDTYLQGRTPSPCIMCNKEIKLGLLADKARELGADIIVTGHYAEIRQTENGIELHKGKNPVKDQSYFLFGVEKKNLNILRCPLADYTKEQTRALAAEAGLEVAQKSDSQDICFVSDGKYAELISTLNPQIVFAPGDIVDKDGKVLGRHNGIIHYTIGQRRGLGIGGNIGILYVTGIDVNKNQVIVGPKEELKQKSVWIENINWLGEERSSDKMELEVKLRSRQEVVPAEVEFFTNGTALVHLVDDFYGVAPGQGCCFYQGTRVLGGGFIKK